MQELRSQAVVYYSRDKTELNGEINALLTGKICDADLGGLRDAVAVETSRLGKTMGEGEIPSGDVRCRFEFLRQIEDLIIAQTRIVLGFEENIATPPASSPGLDWP
jgi:hypothetical protein